MEFDFLLLREIEVSSAILIATSICRQWKKKREKLTRMNPMYLQVKEFVKSYNALHEMGFTSSNVPELLAIHDNDPDKVIQHLIGTS